MNVKPKACFGCAVKLFALLFVVGAAIWSLLLFTWQNPIISMIVSPDGENVAVVRASGAVQIWDTTDGNLLWSRKTNWGHCFNEALAFNPDGTLLASGSRERDLTVRDASTGVLRLTVDTGQAIDSLTFVDNGKKIIAGGWSPRLQRWDIESGRELPINIAWEHLGAGRYLVPIPDEKGFVTTGALPAYQVWKDGQWADKVILPASSESRCVSALAISHTGKQLAIGLDDGALFLLDFATGKVEETWKMGSDVIDGKMFLSFSPDERHILVGIGGRVIIVDIATGAKDELYAHTYARIAGVQYTVDGRKIIYAVSFGGWGQQSIVIRDRLTRTKTTILP